MELWLVYLLLSTLLGSVADFLAKVLFRQHHGLTVGGYLIASWLVEIVVLLVYVLGWKSDVAATIYMSGGFWLLLLVIVVIRFGVNSLYYAGLRRLDASIVTVLFTCSTIASVIIGILRYGETLSWMKVICVLLTIGSVFLVYSHMHRKKKQQYLFLGVLGAALLYAISVNIEKTVGLTIDPFVFRLRYSLLSVLILLFFYKKQITHDLKYIHETSFWVLNSISALLFLGMNVFYYFSFAAGAEAGKVDAINNIGIFIIIALEILIFREHSRLWVKIRSALLACCGVWMLR